MEIDYWMEKPVEGNNTFRPNPWGQQRKSNIASSAPASFIVSLFYRGERFRESESGKCRAPTKNDVKDNDQSDDRGDGRDVPQIAGMLPNL